MEEILPIIIYLLLIVLLIVAIVLGIKLIFTLNKVDEVIDDVNGKIKSLDKLFEVVDFATNRMSIISETVISFATTFLKKLFGSKSEKEDEIDE